MKPCTAFACLVILAGTSLVYSAEPSKVPGRQTKTVEGWTLHISDELFEKDKAATERALELLTVQLQEITRVVPAAAVAELQKVPLWFSPEYPGVQPRAEYHPGAGWLRENKRNPAMEKAVEFTDIRDFERETKRMPNFTLHELAHAYHDRVLSKGFGNEEIKAAFEKAKAKGLYDRVEQRFGDGRSANVRAYAMTNPMEYFAECSEAFFSTNDFFPFNREQLKKHDPEMFALLTTLWSGEADKAKTADKSTTKENADYRAWKHSGSLWLLTTPEGADLPADARVEQFPVLVRLHRDFFDFAQANPNGDDLRFSSSTGERLAFQIEEWDAAKGVASVWVRVPLITGNSRQEIKLRWGNANAASESDGKAVFNEANGYLSVWHMNDPVRDDTGTLTTTDTGTTATQGVIGAARHLPGGKGVFCGDKILDYPTGSNSHTTEVWFRPERPNTTLIAWGNEQAQGKVVMQFRSPPHIQMDCYFSGGNVGGASRVPVGDWT
ncbi:MAG: zinc-dependent peptidase, partial [Pirellulaceae bacterium]